MPADKTVKDLDRLYTQGKSARGRLEGDWYLNCAYYDNQQWLAWNGTSLWRPKLKPNRITVVDNRIRPAVQKEIAKLTKSQPVFTVTPSTGDEEDANAAELGEQIMEYLWLHLKMQELSTKALYWSRLCGAGFLKCFWDPTVGDSVEVLVGGDGQPVAGPNGGPIRADSSEAPIAHAAAQGMGHELVVKKIAQGDIRCEVRSPFQMVLDPIAETFSEVEWVIEETVKSVEYVKRRYGIDADADTPANPGLIEGKMSGGIAVGSALGGGSSAYKGVRVREYWCKPNSDHPDGYKATWIKDKIVDRTAEPFDPMPYVMIPGIHVPGRIWPTSIAHQMRGPQTELNKVKSQIAENRNRVGNPTVLLNMQAVRDRDNVLDHLTVPGGVLDVDMSYGNQPPVQFLPAPPLPDYVVEEIQRIEESLEAISGQHDVTNAQVPPGVTAASAINLLQETDDNIIQPSVRDYESTLGAFGQKIMDLVARYYTDTRTIQIAGDDGAWQIFDFRGAMLRGNTHVEVQAGSAFPHSKAAKQAAMQDLLTFFVQSGNPPHGRQLAQFLKDWEVGGADRLIEDYTRDETQVHRENSKLLRGEALPTNDFDNDQAHIDGHEDMQKSTRYEQSSPQAKLVTEQHVAEHRQKLAAQQQQELQQQMMLNGTPPPEAQGAQMQMDLSGQAQQQGLDAAQAQQQMDQQATQAGQQIGLAAENAEQKQRHTEMSHQQSYAAAEQQRIQQSQHAEEQHRQRLQHAQELHEARIAQIRSQSQRSNRGGRQNTQQQ